MQGTLTDGNRVVKEELERLIDIKKQSWARNLAVQEDDKEKIADIFAKVNQARENLMVSALLLWSSSVEH